MLSKLEKNNTEKNPWQKESSKEVYQNPWIRLREDQVINPGGGKNIYGVVEFKNRAIGIIPFDDQGNTWLVGQYRYPLDEYSWEIPMGGGPLELDSLESAKRELLEETGLEAKNWKCICRIHTSNSVTNEEGFIFLASDLKQGNAAPEETEDLRIMKLPLEKALEMVNRNQITDSLSIAGLLKAWSLKQRGLLENPPSEEQIPWK